MKKKCNYTFTFVRHAQSIYNRDGKSGPDPALSSEGREQASLLDGKYDYALVSCMSRTKETFNLSNIDCKAVEYSSLCREAMSPGMVSNLMAGEKGVYEADDDFDLRMNLLTSFLEQKAIEYDNILILCHYGVIRHITGEELGNTESIGLDSLK